MILLLFHEETRLPLKSDKMTKRSYITQMTLDQKYKGTLFSSTFKVEDKKVPLFFLIGGQSNEIWWFCDFADFAQNDYYKSDSPGS